eukprot:6534119-Ditylum_brightwellii.AAC.1
MEPVIQYDSTSETEDETEEKTEEEETFMTSTINILTEQNAPTLTSQGNPASTAPGTISSRGGNRIELNIINTFRILTNNLNGFNTINDGRELLDELTILKELKFLAGCFQETNKNWQQSGVYEKIKKQFNKVWSKNKLESSNSPEQTTTKYQSGGSATLITDKWASNICDSS